MKTKTLKDKIIDELVSEFQLQVGDKTYTIYSKSMDTIHIDYWKMLQQGEIEPAKYMGKLIRIRENEIGGMWHYLSSKEFVRRIETSIKNKELKMPKECMREGCPFDMVCMTKEWGKNLCPDFDRPKGKEMK